MAYEQRDNSGTFFENDRKEKDTHPDYTGKAMVDGVMYWASLWVKEKADGSEFFSFSFKPMEQEPQREPQRQPARQPAPASRSTPMRKPSHDAAASRQTAPPRPASGFDDMDDDIPF